MRTDEIRQKFLGFFESKNHVIVPSSSLIPFNDPTLLFTNAGMNQFKDVFLGLEQRSYSCATSVQKCVRAGGKHNDLENVGFTARHHTFFEMLGNFSFGDYFKSTAIKYAWEFLTKILKLDPNRLYVTVYYTDDESYNIWHKEIGLTVDRIIRIQDKANGSSDNFWQMGDTGPCGPCTEIFYDHGAHIKGGLPGSIDEDGDRYVEIWNCVFMQYNRDEQGVLHNLPKPSVDTGMGLERISAVMQNVHSNYEIDIFKNLINKASLITNCRDYSNSTDKLSALKVLADHIRSTSFLISDGVMPDNEGRGYVLRRILRRSIRYGYKLGMREPFFYQLVEELVNQMGNTYTDLKANQAMIQKVIFNEEEKFFQTIHNGMLLLQDTLEQLQEKLLPGEIAFKLYDTYGFPLDLTETICEEALVKVDIDGFNQLMNKQKAQAKSNLKFKSSEIIEYNGEDTQFLGYELQEVRATVVALYTKEGQAINKLTTNTEAIVVLDKTVFYPEGGGQIGDSGILHDQNNSEFTFIVEDTHKIRSQVIGHFGKLTQGDIKVGDTLIATFDLEKRLATARNHSATHLVHKALQLVLGNNATQRGSLVCDKYARFDFSYDKALTFSQIHEIEKIVNTAIMNNYQTLIHEIPYEEALKKGAIALFGEKYKDTVRVIEMGDFSIELCGGTHVKRTGDIGCFIITQEAGVASGIRRIEIITGMEGYLYTLKLRHNMNEFAEILKCQNTLIVDKLKFLVEENKLLYKELLNLKSQNTTSVADELIKEAINLKDDIKFLVANLKDIDNKLALEMVDKIKDRLKSAIIIIGFENSGKYGLIVGVTTNLANNYKAGDIIKYLASLTGGKGGGRAELAQGGAKDLESLKKMLDSAYFYLKTLN